MHSSTFMADLNYSKEAVFDQKLNNAYFEKFPGLVDIRPVNDLAEQLRGIDKKLFFEDGSIRTVEEKKRKADYGDILLEYISNWKTGRPGWVVTCQAETIAYIIAPTMKVYMLPVLFLRMAWEKHSADWIEKYNKPGGDNSLNVAVPVDELYSAMFEQMIYRI